MKILLLEDNESLGEIIKEIFEEKGFVVDWFSDGEVALENCANGYDCFILDIHVPSLDGISLLKQIRLIEKDTPSIIISSNIELPTIQKAYLYGCNDFLKKPFYMYELEKKVDMLCAKPNQKITFENGYEFDPLTQTLQDKQKQSVKLTQKEQRFLTLLAKTPNVALNLSAIEQYVWEGEDAGVHGVRSLVKRVRAKVGAQTVQTSNYGYTLKI